MKLSSVGEDALIASLVRQLPDSGEFIGDDCAVVEIPNTKKLLALKTDCVVERIHFDTADAPFWVGWKAMMRPLSDFAAVSGIPRWALITLIVPAGKSIAWVKTVCSGLSAAGKKTGVKIVGGETSNIKGPAAISVSVAGWVEKRRSISRRGGKAGDDLFVTGKLGGSRRGKHLRFVPRIEESRWLTKHFEIHAMMDLSDGLGADLPRLAVASKVGFTIEKNNLPLNRGCEIKNAISDGEDYELLFAISSRERKRLQCAWARKFPTVALTRIGNLTSNIKQRTFLPGGYVHFQ